MEEPNSEIINFPEYVDCIIFTILEEEKNSLLGSNEECFSRPLNSFIHIECDQSKTSSELGITRLDFFDKDGIKRNCVICNFKKKEDKKRMGNAEAGKLFYLISREFISDFYINVGVTGAFSDKAKLATVYFVNSTLSLISKDSNSQLSTGLQPVISYQIADTVFNSIQTNTYIYNKIVESISTRIDTFLKNNLKDKEILTKYLPSRDVDEKAEIKNKINHDSNKNKSVFISGNKLIKEGNCLTFPFVLKNKEEIQTQLTPLQNWDLVDMEAAFFQEWHSMMQKIEPTHCPLKSELLLIKSTSDTCEEKSKKQLSPVRTLAMENIFDVLSQYLAKVHTFSTKRTESLFLNKYIYQQISKEELPNILNQNQNELFFDNFFSLIAEINNKKNSQSLLAYLCELLSDNYNSIIITGDPGKGKNVLLALIFKSYLGEKIYISIEQIIRNTNFSLDVIIDSLFDLFEKTEKKYVIFFADFEFLDDKIKSEKILNLLGKYKSRITFCISYSTNKFGPYNQYIDRFIKEIRLQKEVTEVRLNNVSSFDTEKVEKYIRLYADIFLFNKLDSAKNNFIRNCINLMNFIDTSKKEIKHIDMHLMQLLEQCDSMFLSTEKNINFCSIVEAHCEDNKNELSAILTAAKDKKESNLHLNNALQKNVYCRAFAHAKYLYTMIEEMNSNIECLNNYEFHLSDCIDYFMRYLFLNAKQKELIFNSVIENIDSVKEDVQHELLYLMSKNTQTDDFFSLQLKEIIEAKIVQINLDSILNNKESCILVIKYRTLALLLNRYDNPSYLAKFVEKIANNNCNTISKVNLSFYINYYSQEEFTYENVFEISRNTSEKATRTMLNNSLHKLIKLLNASETPSCNEDRMYYYTLQALVVAISDKRCPHKDIIENLKKVEITKIDGKYNKNYSNS